MICSGVYRFRPISIEPNTNNQADHFKDPDHKLNYIYREEFAQNLSYYIDWVFPPLSVA